MSDLERAQALPCDTSDLQLGAAVVVGLLAPRTLRVDRAAHWQAERRLLLQAFGVRTDRAWLTHATSASVERLGDTVRVSPWRRAGKQNSWVGRLGDPVGEAAAADAEQVGRSLRELLSRSLPPG